MEIPLNINSLKDEGVITLDESVNITGAMDSMHDADVWSLVVNRNGKPYGVVTERDMLRRCFRLDLDPSELTIGEIMSYPLITIEQDLAVGAALNLLMTDGIRRLFVVDKKGALIGRVTQTQCLKGTLELIMGMQQVFEQR